MFRQLHVNIKIWKENIDISEVSLYVYTTLGEEQQTTSNFSSSCYIDSDES